MSAPAPVPRRLASRVEEWVSERWDLVLGSAAAAFFAASGILVDYRFSRDQWYSNLRLSWLCVGIGTILFFVAGVCAARRVRRVRNLEEAVASSEHDRAKMQSNLDESRNSINRIMDRLCQQFGSAMRATTRERVTVYAMHPDGFFVRLARCSSNPNFEGSGRTKYPQDEGIVADAWAHEFSRTSISRNRCPNDGVWPREMSELSGIPKKTLKAMIMKSKVLYAQRITNVATGKPCAVLVYESTNYLADLQRVFGEKGQDPEAVFRSIFKADLGAALMDAVGIASTLVRQVDPDIAAQEGF